jgi:hypothetical protein
MSFSIRKNYTKGAKTISTSFNFMGREGTPPYVKKHLLLCPHNINKMPVEYSEVKSYCFGRCCTWLYCVTHCLVNSTNCYVETMKACSQVKCTTINSVTKCKRRRSILNILTIHKEYTQSNSNKQIQTTKVLFVII